jgi:hypothetical protein
MREREREQGTYERVVEVGQGGGETLGSALVSRLGR